MVKLVLSRKGFDSGKGAGGGSSPYLVDERRLVSLPIPDSEKFRRSDGLTRYADISVGEQTLSQLVASLHPGFVERSPFAHLDPDLTAQSMAGRSVATFRGLMGQANAAASHLCNQGVDAGDVFLFFGRFRPAERADGRLRWTPRGQPFHAIFGYLEVDRRIVLTHEQPEPPELEPIRAFAPTFPHLHERQPRQVVIYIARQQLSFEPSRPGFGLFRYQDSLRLTRPHADRLSAWQLPAVFDEVQRLTYNPRTARRAWHVVGKSVEFFAASRGQEFICEPTPGVREWSQKLVANTELWDDGLARSHNQAAGHNETRTC